MYPAPDHSRATVYFILYLNLTLTGVQSQRKSSPLMITRSSVCHSETGMLEVGRLGTLLASSD